MLLCIRFEIQAFEMKVCNWYDLKVLILNGYFTIPDILTEACAFEPKPFGMAGIQLLSKLKNE